MTNRKNLEEWKKELVGKQFGRLTVLDIENYLDKSGKKKGFSAICRCTCGKEKSIPTNSLLKGLTTSCGCYRKEVEKELGNDLTKWRQDNPEESQAIIEKNNKTLLDWRENHKEEMQIVFEKNVQKLKCKKQEDNKNKLEDLKKTLIGRKFGKLTVVDVFHYITPSTQEHNGYKAVCKCVCGRVVNTFVKKLLNDSITSCGCVKKEISMRSVIKISKEESEIYNYLLSLGYIVDRQFSVGGHFFDFRISGFLIEYHGSTYHYTEYQNIDNPDSKEPLYKYKDVLFHKNLRILAIENGYKLLQIWDYDWLNNKEFIKNLISEQLSGKADYKDYLENNLLNNDYGFVIDGEQVEPRGFWVSTGYRKIVNEEYSKGKVLVYNSGYTKITD